MSNSFCQKGYFVVSSTYSLFKVKECLPPFVPFWEYEQWKNSIAIILVLESIPSAYYISELFITFPQVNIYAARFYGFTFIIILFPFMLF